MGTGKSLLKKLLDAINLDDCSRCDEEIELPDIPSDRKGNLLPKF